MSKNNVSSKNDQKLPEKVRGLIIRKLSHLRKEHERLLVSSNQASYTKLVEEILENVCARRMGRAFISVPIEAYREIAAQTTISTKEWPGIAWENIKPILDGIFSRPSDSLAINAIIDEFTWSSSHQPFTLRHIEPEQFKETVIREARRYGGISEAAMTTFDRQLSIVAIAAQVGIINEARHARERINLAIDEYLLTKNQGEQLEGHDTDDTAEDNPDCLPSPPKYCDHWFLAIRVATSIFQNERGRCPNESEAWIQLRSAPPSTYNIEPGIHNGEPAIFMDEAALGKRAFGERWKRYTAIK